MPTLIANMCRKLSDRAEESRVVSLPDFLKLSQFGYVFHHGNRTKRMLLKAPPNFMLTLEDTITCPTPEFPVFLIMIYSFAV